MEGRLESEENARRYLEADRALLAKLLERERLRREEVERERDELLRRLEVLGGPPSVEEATAGEAGREGPRPSRRRRSYGRRAALAVAERVR